MDLRRWYCTILALLFSSLILEAQNLLLITTDPIGARLTLNESEIPGRTPLVLRDLPAGSYRLQLTAAGHPPLTTTIEIATTTHEALRYRLPRNRFVPAPYETSLSLDNQALAPGEKGISLPEGSYRFVWNDETLAITPIYPREGLLRALDILAPSCLLLAGLIAGQELFYQQDRYFSISPFSVSLAAAGGVLGILDLRLRAARRDYRRRIDPIPVGRSGSGGEAELLYRDARQELGSGRTALAVSLLERLIGEYGTSVRVPEALYTLARVRLLRGEMEPAAAEFRLIIEKYPDPLVYDKAWKGLADYHQLRGEYEAAAAALEEIVYLDPAFQREEIESLISEYRNSPSEATLP